MTIAGMLRVKNEARWITDVLAALQPLCDPILVFDDHSTDGTRELVLDAGAELIESPFRDGKVNETRDKNLLLVSLRQRCSPDWVVHIDGDEILEAGGQEKIRRALVPEVAFFTLRVRYLWDRRDQVRTDGIYGRFKRGSIFRLAGQPMAAAFKSTGNGGNFHCGNVPVGLQGTHRDLEVGLLHLGYLHREDRLRKYDWYNREDRNNLVEDQYRHMVQGDLPSVPADAKLRWAGPLTIEKLHAR